MYLKHKQYRLVDLYAMFDIRKDWSVSKKEFLHGLKVCGVVCFIYSCLLSCILYCSLFVRSYLLSCTLYHVELFTNCYHSELPNTIVASGLLPQHGTNTLK